MTTLRHKPLVKKPTKRVRIVDKEPPRRNIRWIAWTISIVVIGLGALVALLQMRGEPTLEELQASVGSADQVLLNRAPQLTTLSADQLTELEASVGAADRVLRSYIDRAFSGEELAALQASVGSADQKWLMRVFSQEELAALQASVGSADQKWLQN